MLGGAQPFIAAGTKTFLVFVSNKLRKENCRIIFINDISSTLVIYSRLPVQPNIFIKSRSYLAKDSRPSALSFFSIAGSDSSMSV